MRAEAAECVSISVPHQLMLLSLPPKRTTQQLTTQHKGCGWETQVSTGIPRLATPQFSQSLPEASTDLAPAYT